MNNLEEIITGLNKNQHLGSLDPSRIEELGLTAEQKSFLKLYKPEKSLIVYGSLAPGKPNYSVVEHIPGEWKKATVRGKLEKQGWGAAFGYLAFSHCIPEHRQEIAALVLVSDNLVANWPMLDSFEGEEYRRILAKYELENGEVGVGYIYAANLD